MPHVLSSDTDMPVQCLIELVEQDDELLVRVCWCGLPPEEDTFGPIQRVCEDLPLSLQRLHVRKNTPAQLAACARTILGLSNGGM